MPGSVTFFSCEPTPTGISTLSLHDALPIFRWSGFVLSRVYAFRVERAHKRALGEWVSLGIGRDRERPDRKSTRLNSSHMSISYAVFCLKKKKFKDMIEGQPEDLLHHIS